MIKQEMTPKQKAKLKKALQLAKKVNQRLDRIDAIITSLLSNP